MMKYRVEAEFRHKGYIIVNANSEDEAWDIAEYTDGGEFVEMPETGSCEIEKPQLIEIERTQTNFHMLRKLNFKPRNFGVLTGEEVGYLRDYFQLEERSDLDLQDLRDFVVMYFEREDSLEKQDIMSGIVGVIDQEKCNRGLGV